MPNLTQQELMRQYFAEESAKIVDWDLDNHPENYKLLEARLAQMEAINYESKARAARLHEEKRRYEVKNWDGKVTKKTLTDPRQQQLKKEIKNKATILSKVEQMVANYVSIDYADKDILDAIPDRIPRSEIWAAIRKARGTSEPVLTEEQKQGIAQEEAEEQAKKQEEERAREERKRKYAEEQQKSVDAAGK